MNQKQLAGQADRAISEPAESSRSTALLRRLLIEVLGRAGSGHFMLREKGRVIAEVGDRSDALQAEVNIVDTRCYLKAVLGGDTAAGEAFVNGWWTSPDITQVTRFFARNLDMMDQWKRRFGWLLKPVSLMRMVARANTHKQAKKNILAHYDLGNPLSRPSSIRACNTPRRFIDRPMTRWSKRRKTSWRAFANSSNSALTTTCWK